MLNYKVLVVEDEAELREAYDMILSRDGYEVVCATDGKDALDKTTNFEPDIILLDIRMPIMNGIEFLRIYNLMEHHPNVKVVVFSNLDTQKDIDEAYDLGADKYIIKAWTSPKELLQIVQDCLNE